MGELQKELENINRAFAEDAKALFERDGKSHDLNMKLALKATMTTKKQRRFQRGTVLVGKGYVLYCLVPRKKVMSSSRFS